MLVISERPENTERHPLEGDLEQRMTAVFRRYPALYTFTADVRWVPWGGEGTLERELALSDVGAYPALRAGQEEQLRGETDAVFADLMQLNPDAARLLQSRTFTRILPG
jgi:hypothetical protein